MIDYRFAAPPTADRECLEAIWSQGRSCKRCPVDCYRRGWSKGLVDVDNQSLCNSIADDLIHGRRKLKGEK